MNVQPDPPGPDDLMGLLTELNTAINSTNDENQKLRTEVLVNISKIMNSITSLKEKIELVKTNINSSNSSKQENENLTNIIKDAKLRIADMTSRLQNEKKLPPVELTKMRDNILAIDKSLLAAIESIPTPAITGGKKTRRKTSKKRKGGKKRKSSKKQRGGYVYKSTSSSSSRKKRSKKRNSASNSYSKSTNSSAPNSN